jgi:IclR family acetate operon transcriptional repressor
MSSVKENQSVRNACALLDAIAAEQPIGVSDLARRIGIDKSAAHRLAVTLHRAGWLHQTTEGRWRIAPALAARIADASAASLATLVRPVLVELRENTGETAMLVVIERDRLIALDVADSPHALRISTTIGSEIPIRHSSALRAIAAHTTGADLERLRRIDPDLDDATLAETRRRGWALNDREIIPDARVAGAPILGPDRRPLAALIVCAPASRVDADGMQTIGRRVARAAKHASTVANEPAGARAG